MTSISPYLSEVMVQFHRISDGLGDFGMIRVSPWLHPVLDSLVEKVLSPSAEKTWCHRGAWKLFCTSPTWLV